MKIPAVHNFPFALELARRGYKIRTRAEGLEGWLEWSGGQLRDAGDSDILLADRLTVEDYLRQDWTVYDTDEPDPDDLADSPIDPANHPDYPGAYDPPPGDLVEWEEVESCASCSLTVTPLTDGMQGAAEVVLSGDWFLATGGNVTSGLVKVSLGDVVIPVAVVLAGAISSTGESYTLRDYEGAPPSVENLRRFEVVEVSGSSFKVRPLGAPPSWGVFVPGGSLTTRSWIWVRNWNHIDGEGAGPDRRRVAFSVAVPVVGGTNRVHIVADWGEGPRPVWEGWLPSSGVVSGYLYLPTTSVAKLRAYAHPYPATGPAWRSDLVMAGLPGPYVV